MNMHLYRRIRTKREFRVSLLIHFCEFSIRVVSLSEERGFVVEICKFKIPRFSGRVCESRDTRNNAPSHCCRQEIEEEKRRGRSDRGKLVKESADERGKRNAGEEYLGISGTPRVIPASLIRILLCSRATLRVNFELMRCVFIPLSFSPPLIHTRVYSCSHVHSCLPSLVFSISSSLEILAITLSHDRNE